MLECVSATLTDVLLPAAKNIQTGKNSAESLAGLNFEGKLYRTPIGGFVPD